MKVTKWFKYTVLVSLLIVVAGAVCFFACGGFNLGIDFTGGTMITLKMGKQFEVADIQKVLADNGIEEAPVVKSTDEDGNEIAVVRFKAFEDAEEENAVRAKMVEDLKTQYPDVDVDNIERVGAIAGADLTRNAVYAILIACALMLIYIAIRFQWTFGVSAVIALFHDVLIMIAVVLIVRLQVNSSFIAAILTIVGYSINNTIVIFDRIRENRRRIGSKGDMEAMVNDSVKSTLTRSINTSFTTLLTITLLYILGVDSIREFALPIIVGLVAGTYSSVFLAAPIWFNLQRQLNKKKAKAAKA